MFFQLCILLVFCTILLLFVYTCLVQLRDAFFRIAKQAHGYSSQCELDCVTVAVEPALVPAVGVAAASTTADQLPLRAEDDIDGDFDRDAVASAAAAAGVRLPSSLDGSRGSMQPPQYEQCVDADQVQVIHHDHRHLHPTHGAPDSQELHQLHRQSQSSQLCSHCSQSSFRSGPGVARPALIAGRPGRRHSAHRMTQLPQSFGGFRSMLQASAGVHHYLSNPNVRCAEHLQPGCSSGYYTPEADLPPSYYDVYPGRRTIDIK